MSFKRNLVILAVPAALAVAAVGLIAAKAATPPPPAPAANAETNDANDQQPSYKSSITVAENSDDAALAGKAKITAKQAEDAALKKYPGGTVVGKAELENENGNVVFGVGIKASDGKIYDVKIDAGNGAVLSTEAGGDEAGESKETAEK